MKKTILIAALMTAAVLLMIVPAFAATDWDIFVAEMEKRDKIKEMGAAILSDMREIAPNGTEEELWNKLWNGDARWRAAAAVAIVDRVFPEGDPSRWEEVKGFLPKRSVQSRQLVAMDGLFVAVSMLKELPDGVWGAAYLLDRFGKSGMGKVKFIDEIPAEMRPIIDEIIAETGLQGDWSSKALRGKMPLLPVYRGYITRDTADSLNMQYLDGYGSLSGNGRYAWDRDRGYVYEVVEGTDHFWIFR